MRRVRSVAVVSASGSPGVTVTSLVLAMGLADPDVVVIEASPAGGTAAGLLGLSWTPDIGDVAAETRVAITDETLDRYCRSQAGVSVIVGPPTAGEATAAGARLGPMLAEAMGGLTRPLILDLGALAAGSVMWPAATGAEVTLLVVAQNPGMPGETAARVRHAHALAVGLAQEGANLAAVVVGERPYRAQEMADALGVPVAAVMPFDREGLAEATSAGIAAKARFPLARASRQLAAALGELATVELAAGEPHAVPVNGVRRAAGGHWS